MANGVNSKKLKRALRQVKLEASRKAPRKKIQDVTNEQPGRRR